MSVAAVVRSGLVASAAAAVAVVPAVPEVPAVLVVPREPVGPVVPVALARRVQAGRLLVPVVQVVRVQELAGPHRPRVPAVLVQAHPVPVLRQLLRFRLPRVAVVSGVPRHRRVRPS
jgi:hypothetical protein